MRSVQFPMIRSCGLVLASIEASPRRALSGRPSVASRTAVVALLCSRRWHAVAAAPSAGYAAPAARRLPTAAEAEAELQAWASSAAGSSTLALSGKSLVLCVAALQLHEAAAATQDSKTSSTSFTELVHRYLGALAMHIYKRFNAPGKPSAAAVLYADVESAHIRSESLQASVQYLAHKAFQSSVSSASVRDGAGQVTGGTAADLADTLSAERDLELTLEATLALLAGHQISQVHLAAVAAKEVGTAATAAAMVPHAESTCHYIGNVVALISKPLQAPPTSSAEPAAALSLPPAKREFWAHTAKRLTSVLYVALLSAQSNFTDAQLIGQMFRDLLRRVYGAEGGTFGMRRSLHYTLTVAVPYVLKSFAMILDVFQQQQRAAAERAAAAKAAAAAEKGFGASPRAPSISTSASSTGSPRPRKGVSTKAPGSAAAVGPSSEKMHRATLLVLCVAAMLYIGSSRSNLFSAATPSSSSSQLATATVEPAADREVMQTYKKLSAMAACEPRHRS
ncbi:hypothetical protein conserved [Leishmania donovani]|uniref:Hypothetical_protein_conserved n=1 Tax=Leishmania donovani TaxID=5661 RepID=A0A6J8FCX0_LEIDO|nr:hypothetical protein conserved [Leishmania donovani]VDZ44273.1 hypothetical_protein_conserved [Leishmania donovani]